MLLRKALLWIAGTAGATVLVFAGVILSAPLWIDAESVKTRVAERISQATGGRTHFERIDLRFLPLPGVVVTQPHFSLPGVLELNAQSASVSLDPLALFVGRVEPRALLVAAPKVIVQIPEPTPDGKPFSIASLEQNLRSVLAQIAERAPAMQLAVDNGAVVLQAKGHPPLSIDHLRLRASAVGNSVEATLSCDSSLWQQLTLQMNVTGELAGHGSAQVVGLRVHDLGSVLGKQENWPVREAIATASVQWQIKGLSDAQAEGKLSLPVDSHSKCTTESLLDDFM